MAQSQEVLRRRHALIEQFVADLSQVAADDFAFQTGPRGCSARAGYQEVEANLVHDLDVIKDAVVSGALTDAYLARQT